MATVLSVVEFVVLAGLSVDFVVRRGSQVLTWLKGAEATVASKL